MATEPNFESMSFKPFSNNNIFSGGNQYPDVNFFLGNIPSLNAKHFLLSDIKAGFSKFESSGTFSVLHLSIMGLRKGFQDFKELYEAHSPFKAVGELVGCVES